MKSYSFSQNLIQNSLTTEHSKKRKVEELSLETDNNDGKYFQYLNTTLKIPLI